MYLRCHSVLDESLKIQSFCFVVNYTPLQYTFKHPHHHHRYRRRHAERLFCGRRGQVCLVRMGS